MLRSIFYARFHSERGPVILRQHPQNAIFGSKRGSQDDTAAVQFSDISAYVIPPYELCNKALSVGVSGSTVLGLPISIEDAKYPRNRFTFNVCFVLDEELTDSQRRAWDAIVNKTAAWFKCIELEQEVLSSIDEAKNLSSQDLETDAISAVLRQVYEQLNHYDECCVQLTEVYVLNLRLHIDDYKPRKTVNSWDVPLVIAQLPGQDYSTWDLVLQQIYPYINGVNHIKRIATLADVELQLVHHAVEELHHAGLVMLLDIFHFQAIYAPTKALSWFVRDTAQITECCKYVAAEHMDAAIQPEDILELYFCFRQGVTVAQVCLEHAQLIKTIDVRRLVTFGVIKGFLRRVHKYAQLHALPMMAEQAVPAPQRNPYEDAVKKFEDAWKQAALSSGWATPPATLPASIKAKAHKSVEEARREEDEKLKHFLDGKHCFDEICVEMGMTEKTVLEKLTGKQFGDITFFTR